MPGNDSTNPLTRSQCTTLLHTRRGQSRAQHVRDREADIERAKKWGPEHLRRSKGEACSAEPTFGLCFCGKVLREAMARPEGPRPNLGPRGEQCSPLIFLMCAEKYSVWAAHIYAWAPEFFLQMSPETRTKSVTRLMSLDPHPVSTLQNKVQSPAALFPSNVGYITHMILKSLVAVGNCRASFFCHVRGRTATQPHSLEGTLEARPEPTS